MKHAHLARWHQARIAKIAISVSAFRNQGDPGMIEAGRRFCSSQLDLSKFETSLRSGTYNKFLNRETLRMCSVLKPFGGKWGTSRKGLNIFLRDVFYSQYFYTNLHLKPSMKAVLEIPLDSRTGLGLKEKVNELGLQREIPVPKWTSVKSVSPELSAKFQVAAQKLAKRLDRRFDAVDLDLWLWVAEIQS